MLEYPGWGLGLLVLVALGAMCLHRRRVSASDSRHTLQGTRAGTGRRLDQLEGGHQPLMLPAQPSSAGPPICPREAAVTDHLL